MVTFSNLGNFGRLGNQLFQIAATIGTANKLGLEAKFPKWEYSDFFESHINQNLNTSEIKNIHREPGFHYSPIPNWNNMDLIGYFQSEKYFSHCKEIIRSHFSIKNSKYTQKKETCSVHVRRTDYLRFSEYHPFPGLQYYESAIRIMKERGIKDFIVFSDDIEWCKQNLPGLNYSEGNSNIEDLDLMSKCGHNIIANSSFSWWGAWLNKNPNKIVIAPSNWFGPAKRGVITDDLYCPVWIKI